MPRTCTICSHQQRQSIDEELLAGKPFRNIAQRFGTSGTALFRHKAHLSGAMVKAQEAKEVVRADSLLGQVQELQAKILAILRKAEGAGDLRTATAAIGQARQNLELLGKLAGELGPDTQVNVLVSSPEWLAVEVAILRALDPFPAAREAVVTAMRRAVEA
jgi:transposase-like protein